MQMMLLNIVRHYGRLASWWQVGAGSDRAWKSVAPSHTLLYIHRFLPTNAGLAQDWVESIQQCKSMRPQGYCGTGITQELLCEKTNMEEQHYKGNTVS